MDEADCFIVSLDVEALENPVGASSQDVSSSVLTRVADGAVGGGRGVGVVSIGHLPSVGEFFVPEPTPSGFEDVEFGFMLDFRGGPEFVAGVWEVVGGVVCPGCGVDAFERVLA